MTLTKKVKLRLKECIFKCKKSFRNTFCFFNPVVCEISKVSLNPQSFSFAEDMRTILHTYFSSMCQGNEEATRQEGGRLTGLALTAFLLHAASGGTE